MKIKIFSLVAATLIALPSICKADGVAPFGIASAYNLVALGTVNATGKTVIAGNISTNADVEGRIAAAGTVLNGTTVGSALSSKPDPWGSLATYDVVSEQGLTNSGNFNVNSHGNVYAPGTDGNINFNGGGHRVNTGGSGIDFDSLRTELDAKSLSLAALTATGELVGTNSPLSNNPSNFVLYGTSSTLNIFNITAAEFGDVNHPLDIIAPAGSTIIINVSGTSASLGTALYFNNQQGGNSDIVFNFSEAQDVTLNGSISGTVLAPFAVLTGNAQTTGTIIAAAINGTGEVHNQEFTGTLPDNTPTAVTPEPASLALMGTGITALAGFLRRRRS
ncbi:MAG TPA: choice-of-anchor A family protein [Edaphobacter sp.]